MLKGKEFLIALIVGSLLGTIVLSSDEQTDEEKKAECHYLNNVRTNYTFCCQYPVLVMWRWAWDACLGECADKCVNNDCMNNVWGCCINSCAFRSIGALKPKEDNPALLQVDHTGLLYSFLLSVGNDSVWLPILESSTKKCYDQFDNAGEGYICDVMPIELWTIISCCYLENYIRCPKWNADAACHLTMKYAKKCLRGDN